MRELVRMILTARWLVVTALAAAFFMVAPMALASLLSPLPTLPWWAYWMPWVLFGATHAVGWHRNRKRDD